MWRKMNAEGFFSFPHKEIKVTASQHPSSNLSNNRYNRDEPGHGK